MAVVRKREEEETPVLSVLGAAMLQGAAGGDERVRELLLHLIEEQLEQRKKKKDQMHRMAESAAQAAREEAAVRASREANCAHRKQNGETRLGGQYLSNGQLSLICSFCHKNFFHPAQPGQTEPPRELVPPADEIGG